MVFNKLENQSQTVLPIPIHLFFLRIMNSSDNLFLTSDIITIALRGFPEIISPKVCLAFVGSFLIDDIFITIVNFLGKGV